MNKTKPLFKNGFSALSFWMISSIKTYVGKHLKLLVGWEFFLFPPSCSLQNIT
jgi:hypothetical protein